jgi:hypothetical protein
MPAHELAPTPRLASLAVAALLVLAGCSGGGDSSDPAPPQPPPLDPQVRISGASPFAPGCDQATPTGTLYVNSEVEPHVAVNPSNPNHLVAAWQQDRWSNGAARGLRSASRSTAGAPGRLRARRSRAAPAATPRTEATTSARATRGSRSAPTAPRTRSRSGVGHLADNRLVGRGAGRALGRRRRDLGAPVALIRDVGIPFNDKETMTADYTDARFAYAVWDRLDDASGRRCSRARPTAGARGSPRA